MNCPHDLAELLLTVIQTGVLRIRAAGWAGDATRCSAEADHIHNLAALARDYADERLRYYWHVERVAFINRIGTSGTAQFEPIWDQMRAFVDKIPVAASA